MDKGLCVSKRHYIWLAWEILRYLYRSPLTGKLHFSKMFYLCFQNQELWHMFSLCFLSRVFDLSIKSHGSRVSPSFFKAPSIESIIFILIVTCIVPKYHIVFCMIVILLVLKFLVLVSFKTLEEFSAFMFCFTHGG